MRQARVGRGEAVTPGPQRRAQLGVLAHLPSMRRPGRGSLVPHPSSKSALNMVAVQYAKAFPAMRINAVDPGFTATDFNQHRGTQTVGEGAEIIVRMASIGPDGPTGGYFSAAGPVPW